MGLNADARGTKEAFMAQMDADVGERVGAGLEALSALHPAANALGEGTRAPDFERAEVRGGSVRLSRRLADGPVVLSFFRGAWCPFCGLELRSWGEHLPELQAAGGQLIAISPEATDQTHAELAEWEPPFAVLTDADHSVAAAYGLVFDVPEAACEAQRLLEAPLDRLNADGTWRLPVPATYVIDASRTIRWAYASDDYTERAEPETVIEAVRALGAPARAD
jgi:peroxiredoxin